MRIFKLGARLGAIAELVPPGVKLYDVGTDHARLPVYLIYGGRIQQAVASDVAEGPLAAARVTAGRFGADSVMSFVLCDGVPPEAESDAGCIVIAGMGGETIQGILARAPWALQENRLLILEPQSKQEELRRWLYAQNCGIRSEHLVRDAGRIYPILCAGGSVCREPDFADFKLGHWPPETRDDLFFAYLDAQILKIDRAIAGLENSQIQENLERLAQLRILRSQLMTLESRK